MIQAPTKFLFAPGTVRSVFRLGRGEQVTQSLDQSRAGGSKVGNLDLTDMESREVRIQGQIGLVTRLFLHQIEAHQNGFFGNQIFVFVFVRTCGDFDIGFQAHVAEQGNNIFHVGTLALQEGIDGVINLQNVYFRFKIKVQVAVQTLQRGQHDVEREVVGGKGTEKVTEVNIGNRTRFRLVDAFGIQNQLTGKIHLDFGVFQPYFVNGGIVIDVFSVFQDLFPNGNLLSAFGYIKGRIIDGDGEGQQVFQSQFDIGKFITAAFLVPVLERNGEGGGVLRVNLSFDVLVVTLRKLSEVTLDIRYAECLHDGIEGGTGNRRHQELLLTVGTDRQTQDAGEIQITKGMLRFGIGVHGTVLCGGTLGTREQQFFPVHFKNLTDGGGKVADVAQQYRFYVQERKVDIPVGDADTVGHLFPVFVHFRFQKQVDTENVA